MSKSKLVDKGQTCKKNKTWPNTEQQRLWTTEQSIKWQQAKLANNSKLVSEKQTNEPKLNYLLKAKLTRKIRLAVEGFSSKPKQDKRPKQMNEQTSKWKQAKLASQSKWLKAYIV